jgi:hypothetical protein
MPSEQALDLRAIGNLVIAGWTGRNISAVEEHIEELAKLGVPRPNTVPIFYRVAASLLTDSGSIEVVTKDSSGEVEFVLYAMADGLWLGIGSDHTDRKIETIGVTISKQICAKPVGARIWRYDDVAPHWDRLVLRAFIHVGTERRLYQEGPVTTMRSPEELMTRFTNGGVLAAGTAMFCGTLAVIGGIVPADSFEMELEDPVLGRKLKHAYRIITLPNEG